eukprot:2899367-Amphidinium_carterae.1
MTALSQSSVCNGKLNKYLETAILVGRIYSVCMQGTLARTIFTRFDSARLKRDASDMQRDRHPEVWCGFEMDFR